MIRKRLKIFAPLPSRVFFPRDFIEAAVRVYVVYGGNIYLLRFLTHSAAVAAAAIVKKGKNK